MAASFGSNSQILLSWWIVTTRLDRLFSKRIRCASATCEWITETGNFWGSGPMSVLLVVNHSGWAKTTSAGVGLWAASFSNRVGAVPQPLLRKIIWCPKAHEWGAIEFVLKCSPCQTGSSSASSLPASGWPSSRPLRMILYVPWVFIGGWKFVGCYQTFSTTCVAAICTCAHTLGRLHNLRRSFQGCDLPGIGVLWFSP